MAIKTIIDYMSEEDYNRFNEFVDIATQAKANAPKAERKPRGPLTDEQKLAAAQKRYAKAQAALDALLASMNQ